LLSGLTILNKQERGRGCYPRRQDLDPRRIHNVLECGRGKVRRGGSYGVGGVLCPGKDGP